jgi:transposase InsO family protein
MKLQRSVYYYHSVARDSQVLSSRICEITQTRVHYGYRRVHVLLRREGFKDNHKRVDRLYREQGLSLRYKRPKRNKAAELRQPKMLANQIHQI